MRAIKQTVTVPVSRELNIKLPEEAIAHEEAEIIVLFKSVASSPDDKFTAMESAMSDKMFLADLHEAMGDFEHADSEGKIA
ncbi:MAG: hypothetical protein H0W76_05115 [Pyrinomonadaceae bacterium]|nr:hypothetical protein [Pyrinomonadaceae bacterium]